MMIAALIATQIVQAQPLVQQPPKVSIQRSGSSAVLSRKQRTVNEARALLSRAEEVRAGYQPVNGGPSKAEVDGSIDQMKSDLDSLSEMGEMESLRLQMAMDRMSKMMSTLSNLLKKISDTQQGITQNLK